jgi:hypothetical protein
MLNQPNQRYVGFKSPMSHEEKARKHQRFRVLLLEKVQSGVQLFKMSVQFG